MVLALVGVVVVLVIVVVGHGSSGGHKGDVKVLSCSRTDFTGPTALLEITNSSSASLEYSVTVTFHAADGTSGEGFTHVAVGPGQSQQAQVDAVGNRGPMPTSCDVTDVSAS
ncbi:MAG: hypothetical protein JO222_09090 [Frankiales bacterium]|nr:hypothetical protein [Frankiales bacterium]